LIHKEHIDDEGFTMVEKKIKKLTNGRKEKKGIMLQKENKRKFEGCIGYFKELV